MPGQKPLPVLGALDFEVERGAFATLLGPSGCGKTTLLRIIAGLEKQDAGEVCLSNRCLLKPPIIWQEHRLFPWRTVTGNIAFPLEIARVGKVAAKEKTDALMRLVGLEGFGNYYPDQISGGMAQRVAIARALATESLCLLMDEPFASVDYQTKQALFRELQHLLQEHGLTILYVTHDLRDAIQFSDVIFVLSARPARVLETIHPPAGDLNSSPLEERLWALLRQGKQDRQ